MQGEYLKKHLDDVAESVEKLLVTGWICELALYSLELIKDINAKQAKKELSALQINLDILDLIECPMRKSEDKE